MKKVVLAILTVFFVLGTVSSIFAEIREKENERGGAGLQNVYDRVLCVDGFKVFQTIVFGFSEDGGAAVSNIQLMEEENGKLVPTRCSK